VQWSYPIRRNASTGSHSSVMCHGKHSAIKTWRQSLIPKSNIAANRARRACSSNNNNHQPAVKITDIDWQMSEAAQPPSCHANDSVLLRDIKATLEKPLNTIAVILKAGYGISVPIKWTYVQFTSIENLQPFRCSLF